MPWFLWSCGSASENISAPAKKIRYNRRAMKTPTRFIASLTEAQRAELNEVMRSHPNARTRMRAHAVLLSARGYAIDRIADIYEVDRDSVSTWLDRWEQHGAAGLEEQPRRRPPPAPSARRARAGRPEL